MGIDGQAGATAVHDQIDAPSVGKIDVADCAEMSKQAHPEPRKGFVIKMIRSVMDGEGPNLRAHSNEGLIRRQPCQIV